MLQDDKRQVSDKHWFVTEASKDACFDQEKRRVNRTYNLLCSGSVYANKFREVDKGTPYFLSYTQVYLLSCHVYFSLAYPSTLPGKARPPRQ